MQFYYFVVGYYVKKVGVFFVGEVQVGDLEVFYFSGVYFYVFQCVFYGCELVCDQVVDLVQVEYYGNFKVLKYKEEKFLKVIKVYMILLEIE